MRIGVQVATAPAKPTKTILIDGVEFIVDPRRKKLTRKDANAKDTPRKVLMNGQKYVRSKHGNLVLRNHDLDKKNKTWRRQSSLKKKQKHCVFYRHGKCVKTACRYIHDPDHIQPCKYLFTNPKVCPKSDCHYAHIILDQTRPTCLKFEKNSCFDPSCAYAHVKPTESGICSDFANTGYCAQGLTCSQYHLYLCPEFEATDVCPRERCRMTHRVKTMDDKPGKRSHDSLENDEDGQVPLEPDDLIVFGDLSEHDSIDSESELEEESSGDGEEIVVDFDEESL